MDNSINRWQRLNVRQQQNYFLYKGEYLKGAINEISNAKHSCQAQTELIGAIRRGTEKMIFSPRGTNDSK